MDFDIITQLVYSIRDKKNYLINIPNIHLRINRMFDMLKLNKYINDYFINCFYLITGEKIYNLHIKQYPKELPRIRGSAEYYKYNNLYIIFASGEPYIFLYKYKKN